VPTQTVTPNPLVRRRKRRVFRWFRRSFLVLLSLWLVLSIWQAPVVQTKTGVNQELRGVWMTNIGAALMYYTTRLDDVIANLAEHRMNTLYPAVWSRGFTLYPSSIANQASGRASHDPLASLSFLPHQDILSGLVDQAHRQHPRLIPWFEYGLMIPVNSAIAYKHPDWLTTNQKGDKKISSAIRANRPPDSLQAFKQPFTGGDLGWLNPLHPEVQQFLTNLIVDVVKRYPVDGIQLDDHFSLPVNYGYDAYTINLYRQNHNGRNPPPNPTDCEWMAWRAERLTQLMTKISTAVRAIRPSIAISLSPNAPDFAYQTSLQGWPHWVKLGLLDEGVVQVYREDLASLKDELLCNKLQSLKTSLPISVGLYTGPFLSPKSAQQLQKEIATVQSAHYNGVSQTVSNSKQGSK